MQSSLLGCLEREVLLNSKEGWFCRNSKRNSSLYSSISTFIQEEVMSPLEHCKLYFFWLSYIFEQKKFIKYVFLLIIYISFHSNLFTSLISFKSCNLFLYKITYFLLGKSEYGIVSYISLDAKPFKTVVLIIFFF